MFKNKSQLLITHSQFLPSPPFPLQGTQKVKFSVLFCSLKNLLQSYFMCLSTRLFSCPASRNKRATYPPNALSFPTPRRPMGMNSTEGLEDSRAVALIRKAIVAVTFLVTGIKHMTQSNISRKRMVVARSAGESIHRGLEGTGWGTGAVCDGRVLAGPIHREAEREAGQCLSSMLSLSLWFSLQSQPLAGCHILLNWFPSSVSSLWDHHHRHTQRYV